MSTVVASASAGRVSNGPIVGVMLSESASSPVGSRLDVASAIPMWTAGDSYEPSWSADRAADFRHRWRTTAEAMLPVGR